MDFAAAADTRPRSIPVVHRTVMLFRMSEASTCLRHGVFATRVLCVCSYEAHPENVTGGDLTHGNALAIGDWKVRR